MNPARYANSETERLPSGDPCGTLHTVPRSGFPVNQRGFYERSVEHPLTVVNVRARDNFRTRELVEGVTHRLTKRLRELREQGIESLGLDQIGRTEELRFSCY